MALEFGTVVLVPFPFTNQMGMKRRPAVVVSSQMYASLRPDVVVLALTSRAPAAPTPLEFDLEDWRTAGLAKPSRVKPVALTIERTVIASILGALTPRDRVGLAQLLRNILGDEVQVSPASSR